MLAMSRKSGQKTNAGLCYLCKQWSYEEISASACARAVLVETVPSHITAFAGFSAQHKLHRLLCPVWNNCLIFYILPPYSGINQDFITVGTCTRKSSTQHLDFTWKLTIFLYVQLKELKSYLQACIPYHVHLLMVSPGWWLHERYKHV